MSSLDESGAPVSPFAPGTLLGGGKYRIESPIGEGAMGLVLRATQVAVDRPVAIKFLIESRLDLPNARERFKTEAQVVARLRHPNIVTLYEAEIEPEGLAYLVFEYLPGRPLSAERGKAMEPWRVANIGRQIGAALRAAHRCGIVHRDLKPGNIQLVEGDEPDFVKVLDFGVAKLLRPGGSAPPLTAAGQVLGTLRYMAPEQIRGGEIDGRADLYALGCILFQLLTGRPPFEAEHGPALINQHLLEPPPRFSQVRPELSIDDRVESIVQLLLAKHPEDRPDAETVERALAERAARPITADARTAASPPADFRLGASKPPLPAGFTQSAIIADRSALGSTGGEDRDEASAAAVAAAESVRSKSAEPVRIGPPMLSKLVATIGGGLFTLAVYATFFHRTTEAPSSITVPVVRPRAKSEPVVTAPEPRLVAGLVGQVQAAGGESSKEQTPRTVAIPAERLTSDASTRAIEGAGPAGDRRAERSQRATLRAIRVISGPADPAAIEGELRSREADVARCFEKTQRTKRTIRLTIVGADAKQEIDARPSDEATTAFLACVRAIEPPLALTLPRTSGVQVISAELGHEEDR